VDCALLTGSGGTVVVLVNNVMKLRVPQNVGIPWPAQKKSASREEFCPKE